MMIRSISFDSFYLIEVDSWASIKYHEVYGYMCLHRQILSIFCNMRCLHFDRIAMLDSNCNWNERLFLAHYGFHYQQGTNNLRLAPLQPRQNTGTSWVASEMSALSQIFLYPFVFCIPLYFVFLCITFCSVWLWEKLFTKLVSQFSTKSTINFGLKEILSFKL